MCRACLAPPLLGAYPDVFAFPLISTIFKVTEQSLDTISPATMAFDDILDYDSDLDALMIADGKFIIFYWDGPRKEFIIRSLDFRREED